MSSQGELFHSRLSKACSDNGTTISEFLVSVGRHPSAGSYMRTKKSADGKLVAYAAKRFNVSAEWLMGLSDISKPISGSRQYVLDQQESELVDKLRLADETSRAAVFRMANAVLQDQETTHVDNVPFYVNDVKPHHLQSIKQRRGDREYLEKKVEGSAAAGIPIATIPEDDLTISVPAKYTGDNYFIVCAQGDSMIGAGIDSGDFCVFQRDAYRDEGAVMYVQVDGSTDLPEGAIKRVFFHGDQTELRSMNLAHAPLFYPSEEVSLNGVLVAVIPPKGQSRHPTDRDE